MTTPTFRPADETVGDDDRALHAEVQRRIIRNTLYIANERGSAQSGAWLRRTAPGTEIRTLWRSCISWGYIGPVHLFVPTELAEATIDNGGNPTVRMLIKLRTNGGNGFVRIYPMNEDIVDATEAQMSDETDGGAPVSEARYAVAESDSSTTDFDLSCIVPVRAGMNRIWVGLQTDIDADVSPIVLSAPYAVNYSDGVGQASHPGVSADNQYDQVAPFYYVNVSPDAASAALGISSRYTVPWTNNATKSIPSDYSSLLTWEATNEEWASLRATTVGQLQVGSFTGLPLVASLGALVRAYIDSISFDLSGSLALEDRQFGAAFRYMQQPSATQSRQALLSTDSVRALRLPVFGPHQELEHRLATSTNATRGVPGYWSAISASSSYTEVRRQSLGCDESPAVIGLQEVPSGVVRRYKVTFAAVLVDLIRGQPNRHGNIVQWRALIVNGGAVVSTGTAVAAQITDTEFGTRSHRALSWSFLRTSTDGCQYGTEGLSFRDMWRLWTPVTVFVDEPSGFETMADRALVLQAQSIGVGGVAVTITWRAIFVSHMCVQTVEASA